MKYLKSYESYNQYNEEEQIDESLKSFLIGSLLALSSLGGVKAQSADADQKISSPETKTEYQIHQSQLDQGVISKLNKWDSKIQSEIQSWRKEGPIKLPQTMEGKYKITKGKGFSASSKAGTGYNKKNCFIFFGPESNPDCQLSLTLKDDGTISVMIGDSKTVKTEMRGDVLSEAGTLLMDQTELRPTDKGYKMAMNLLDMF